MPDRKGVKNLGEDIRFISSAIPSYSFKTGFFVGTWYYWLIVTLLLVAAAVVWYLLRGIESRKADVAGSRDSRAS